MSSALLRAGATLTWNGIPVLSGWADIRGGNDCLIPHAQASGADLVITLLDTYLLNPAVLGQVRAACWIPVDADPADPREAALIQVTGAVPVAMSRFGERVLREAGLDPLHIPHGTDRSVFRPVPGVREACGLSPETFTIGVCAANRDVIRKSFPEQFRAFAMFAGNHPDSLLLVHSAAELRDALDLRELAAGCGVADKVRFPDQHAYMSGTITAPEMAEWYSLLDVLSNCSYAEGFGLPVLEAQACGVPVVVTDYGPMRELCGSGWLVDGEPFWVRAKRGWWCQPSVQGIAAAYEEAWRAREDGLMPAFSEKALAFAAGYDADRVLDEHWVPALAEITARLGIP